MQFERYGTGKFVNSCGVARAPKVHVETTLFAAAAALLPCCAGKLLVNGREKRTTHRNQFWVTSQN